MNLYIIKTDLDAWNVAVSGAMNLENKNVIYVGGFGGIGFASCKHFLQNGVKNLGIFDLREDQPKLKELQDISCDAQVFFIKVNLIDKTNIDAAFAEAHCKMKHFDVIVNGSGIMNEPHIEETVQVNLLGVIYATFAALNYMDISKCGQGGLIVNVSSIVGLDTYGAYAVYTATKHGVNGFTRALADQFYFERTGVGFITICPGTTETPMLAALRINSVTTFKERPPLPNSLQEGQTADDCGQRLVEAVKIAQNGSIWIIKGGKLIEEIPKKY